MAITVALLLLSVGVAQADDWLFEIDWEAVADFADRHFEIPPAWQELYESLTADEVSAFWQDIQTVIESGSLEDWAWLKPSVEQVLRYLETTPTIQPYAVWLRHHLDYFEVAEEAVRRVPMDVKPPAPEPPPPPEWKPTRLLPAVSNRPPSAPVQVEERRRKEASRPDLWIQRIRRRPPPPGAARWVPRLKKAFSDEGVPPEWVWIAEVESAFRPDARSPAGAAGMFQFMPATARRFGLAERPDERLRPKSSATAAARYLRFLYQKFQAWPLALAAYNAGEGTVARALKKTGGKTFEDIAHVLPLETRLYVPKVLATVSVREKVDAARLPAPKVRRSRS